MPRLTILIPCVGGAAEFDATLVSVLQHRPDDCEVLLVHTEPYDDPYDLGSEVQFLRAGRDARPIDVINEGIAAADGEIVHLLSCGVEVTEGWTDAALERFADGDIAAVSPLVLDGEGQRLLAAGVKWTLGGSRRVVADSRIMQGGSGRLRSGILGPTLAAGFYRRDVLQALGGFDARLDPRYVDVDLALSLAALDLRTVCEPASRVLQKNAAEDSRRTPFGRGHTAERIFWRHAQARGKLLSLAMHPFACLGDLFATRSAIGTLLADVGRLLAFLEVGAVHRYQARLAESRQRLAEAAEPATIRLHAPAAAQTRQSASAKRRAA